MPLLSRKTEPHIPEEAARLVQSVPARQSEQQLMARAAAGSGRFDSAFGIGNLPEGWATAHRDGREQPGILGLGYHGEAWFQAFWQTLVAPWLSTPAGLAVANKISNAVARLPLRLVNIENERTKPCPEVFDWPMSRIYNPTFNGRDFKKMCAFNLYRFGMCHILMRFEREMGRVRTVMLRPMDSLTIQTGGYFGRPTWQIVGRSVTWASGVSRTPGLDPDLPEEAMTIYPDGRLLEDQSSPESKWGMLLVVLNRGPGANVGAPPGLMTYNATAAATEAQRHAAEFFRDGTSQQLFVTPNPALEELQNIQQNNEQVKKSLQGNHRATIAPLPYDVKQIGFSAEDSASLRRAVSSIWLPLLLRIICRLRRIVRAAAATLRHTLDYINETEGAVYPVACDLEEEFTRALDLDDYNAGWRCQFDRAALQNLDPKTTADITSLLAKGGHIATDEVREGTGRQPYGEEWSQMPTVDQNRRPADKLGELADAQIEKTKGTAGRPQETVEDEPEYPDPD